MGSLLEEMAKKEGKGGKGVGDRGENTEPSVVLGKRLLRAALLRTKEEGRSSESPGGLSLGLEQRDAERNVRANVFLPIPNAFPVTLTLVLCALMSVFG